MGERERGGDKPLNPMNVKWCQIDFTTLSKPSPNGGTSRWKVGASFKLAFNLCFVSPACMELQWLVLDSQGPHSQILMTGGGGRVRQRYIFYNITTFFLAYPRKSLSPFFATQKVPLLFFATQKNHFWPKFKTQKNHSNPPRHWNMWVGPLGLVCNWLRVSSNLYASQCKFFITQCPKDAWIKRQVEGNLPCIIYIWPRI